MMIIYGGAFDPPHQGHLRSIEAVLNQFPNNEIIVVPGAKPAGAAGAHKTPSASFDDRLKMCEICFSVFGRERVRVSDVEGALPKPNYSIATLKYFRAQFPDTPLALLIGQDQLASFAQWHQPAEILKIASLIVMQRSFGETKSPELANMATVVAKSLGLTLQWDEARRRAAIKESPEGTTIEVLEVITSPAESSLIRNFFAKNEPVPPDWLAPGVMEYIKTKALYGIKNGIN